MSMYFDRHAQSGRKNQGEGVPIQGTGERHPCFA